jgi:D-lactate dehydrogenase
LPKIVLGFGCKVLAFDINKDQEMENLGQYEAMETILNLLTSFLCIVH